MSEEYTNQAKLHWEIEKLKAETANLSKPFYRSPSNFIAAITIILALFGMAAQYWKSDREYKLAEIERQRAMLDLEKLQKEKAEIDRNIEQLKPQLSEILKQYSSAEEKLNSTRAIIGNLEKQVSVLKGSQPASRELQDAIEFLKNALSAATGANSQSATSLEETTRNLNAFQESMASVGAVASPQRDRSLSTYTIGIYYLKNDDKAAATAKNVKALLLSDPKVSFVPLYSRDIKFFHAMKKKDIHEIRYEPEIEKAAASDILKILTDNLAPLEFSLRAVRTKTPSFISIFIYPTK
jgi:tetratricopeptide (TPR) repeat protein